MIERFRFAAMISPAIIPLALRPVLDDHMISSAAVISTGDASLIPFIVISFILSLLNNKRTFARVDCDAVDHFHDFLCHLSSVER